MPLAIALDSPQAAELANDQWVHVEGIFHLDQIDGVPVPRVVAATRGTGTPAAPRR